MKYFKLTLLLFLISFTGNCQGYLKANNKVIEDGNGHEVLLRGIGFGGWMLQEPYMLHLSGIAGTQHEIKNKIKDLIGESNTNQFYDAWLNNYITKTDIDSMAAWGFNSIRLPMHYNLFTLSIEEEPVPGQNTWISKGFEFTDRLLRWCKSNHIYLILDLHAAPGGQGNDAAIADRDIAKSSLWQSEANKQKTIALWKKLAEHYANEPWIGGYDLINETNWGFESNTDKNGCAETKNIPLRQLLMDITTAIRQVDKNHMIFIEANCWANNYKGILPPWDSNMTVSFHKYWNINDQNSIQGFLHIRETYNIPIWLGESGENSNSWFTDAIELMERNKIGWAWWPFKKIGINNPLEVKFNPDYQKIISYWKGLSVKTTQEEALRGLMQLTRDIEIKNNIYHKDVIDALFRQVRSRKTIPFKKHEPDYNPIIFATDYDMGRSGYAYHDLDSANYHVSTGKRASWNKGSKYRNDGVDIDSCSDSPGNGFKVFSIEPGEWLQYTVNVKYKGTYNVTFRTLSSDSTGNIQIYINGKLSEGNIIIPPSEKRWKLSTQRKIDLKKGENKIRVFINNGGFDLNYIKITRAK